MIFYLKFVFKKLYEWKQTNRLKDKNECDKISQAFGVYTKKSDEAPRDGHNGLDDKVINAFDPRLSPIAKCLPWNELNKEIRDLDECLEVLDSTWENLGLDQGVFHTNTIDRECTAYDIQKDLKACIRTAITTMHEKLSENQINYSKNKNKIIIDFLQENLSKEASAQILIPEERVKARQGNASLDSKTQKINFERAFDDDSEIVKNQRDFNAQIMKRVQENDLRFVWSHYINNILIYTYLECVAFQDPNEEMLFQRRTTGSTRVPRKP